MHISPRGLAPHLEAKVGAKLVTATKAVAILGGLVLIFAAGASVISIIGRALIPIGLGPIPGIYEIVQLSCVIAVFCFLPWGQINRGQIAIDFLVDRFPLRFKIFMGLLGDIALTVASIIIAIQMWKGFGERLPYGTDTVRALFALGERPFYTETTFILAMPLWYGFALAAIGAIFFAIVCLYTAWRAVNWTFSGQEENLA